MVKLGTNVVGVFSTCPQSKDVPKEEYVQNVIDVARWSEEFGCKGILVYTDNSIVDPWFVAQIIIEHTDRLAPLIAIQPAYMHPYFVAKKIATLAYLYDRCIYLNMVAGGFKNDLEALNDTTPHDDRYLRLTEYTVIIRKLLRCNGPVSFQGKYYTVKNLKLEPSVPEHLYPGILSSGSSDAGMQAAQEMGSIAVKYPEPPGEETTVGGGREGGYGIRIGIIAREQAKEAWAVAHQRFPEDRKGELTHQLAMKVSDSTWHKQLSTRQDDREPRSAYWLGPFQNYKTFCPYLVGDYETVAGLVARYKGLGYETFILDIPPSREELVHTGRVFRRAEEVAAEGSS